MLREKQRMDDWLESSWRKFESSLKMYQGEIIGESVAQLQQETQQTGDARTTAIE